VGYAFSLVEPEELAYMMDVHFFLNRTLSSGYPEFDTAQSSSRSSENGPETDEAAVSIVTGEDEPLAAINKVVSIGPYTRDKMTPDMVHTGLLVQDSIDEENEFVKRFIEEDIQMTNQYRVCENAMKQYHKTRTEATRAGVKAAKLLVKSNAITTIHPLIAGTDVSRCHKGVVEKAAFVRALQTFRPSQTVLETGIGTGSSNNKAQKKALEKANKLQSRTGPNGSKNILPGVEVMQQLRKVMSSSLERSKPKVIVSLGADADTDVDAAVGAESEGRDVFAGFDDDETALAGDDDEYDPQVLQTSDAGRKALTITPSGSGANFRTSRTITSWSGVVADDDDEEEEHVVRSVTMGSSSNPEPKQRLSVADRKKLKKYGEIPEHAPSSSSSSSSAVGVKRSREEEVMASVDTNVFKDKSYYMSYGTEDVRENFAETSLQPQSHLRASEQQSANILEQSMLDVIPEEILELNKKRRLLRWDAKKRKFVKVCCSLYLVLAAMYCIVLCCIVLC
jgi:ATP-dependent RNA helicase DDX54/DBP10